LCHLHNANRKSVMYISQYVLPTEPTDRIDKRYYSKADLLCQPLRPFFSKKESFYPAIYKAPVFTRGGGCFCVIPERSAGSIPAGGNPAAGRQRAPKCRNAGGSSHRSNRNCPACASRSRASFRTRFRYGSSARYS